MEMMIFAGLPTVLLIFVFQVVFGLKPPHEPSWVRNLYFGIPVISFPFAVWWFLVSPHADKLVLSERDFRWRISLVRAEWFRARGHVHMDELEGFSYRSDCFAAEPSDCGKTTAEKLNRILLELNLSRHDIKFHLTNGSEITVERMLARFKQPDLVRFLEHLATSAQRHEIMVPTQNTESEGVS
jgi:hypothetical protein